LVITINAKIYSPKKKIAQKILKGVKTMANPIQNKYDFVLLFDVRMAIPMEILMPATFPVLILKLRTA